MKLEEVCTALEERRRERLTSGWRYYPRRNPIASDLPDCDRELALGLLAWQTRPPRPQSAREAMEQGQEAEEIILKQLRAEGWRIVEQQSPFELRARDGRLILTGKIEGKFVIETTAGRRHVPFEVKDTSFANFNRWNRVEDLRLDRYARKWLRQIYAYCLGFGFEGAVLILAHRGGRKFIPIPLDYDEAERLMVRAEKGAQHAALLEDTAADKLDEELTVLEVPYQTDRNTCQRCDFYRTVCFPPDVHVEGLGEVRVLDDSLGELIERHQELEPYAKEYQSLHGKIERQCERGVLAAAGEWIITGSWETQQTKPVEAKPAQPAGTRRIWHRRFARSLAPKDSPAQPAAVAPECPTEGVPER